MEHVADRLTLFLFRHGETDWNREGRLQGHTDTPLNTTACPSEALAERLRPHRLDALVSSDLARARRLRRSLPKLHLPLFTEAGLRETDVGRPRACYGRTPRPASAKI